MSYKKLLFVVVVSSIFMSTVTFSLADEKSQNKSQPQPGISQAEIGEAIKVLGGNDFKARRQASQTLVKAGSAAIEPVAKTADTDDLELSTRCIEILKRLYRSDNKQVSQKAEEALDQLSKIERRSVAQRAAQALKKPDEQNAGNVVGNAVQIQVQIVAGAGGNRIQIVQQNQNRDIKVEENGKKIHIQETAGKEIKISVTETVDGNETTKEYKARNLDELKKKHPDAAKLYQKHVPKQKNVIRRVIGAPQIQIRGLPAIVPKNQQAGKKIQLGVDRESVVEQLDSANKKLAEAVESLKKMAKSGNTTAKQLTDLSTRVANIQKELDALRETLDD